MQINDLEKIAHEACFSTDYTGKSNGQQYFYNLVQQISMDQLYELMNNYSSTVLFLLMEYLHKTLFNHPDLKALFTVLNQSVSQWFDNSAALVRKDRKQLEGYIEKSVGRTIGYCLKAIYFHNEWRQWVKKAVFDFTNPRYKLYIWINFMEEVSSIDRNIAFLEYRSMVYSFQQVIIPCVMDSLLPFFQSVKQQIQINQLSSNMGSTLSLQQHSREPMHVLVLTPQDSKFTEIVFNVLKQIVCFNYNITYSEYQSQAPIENCLICYPDPVTKKIVSREFIVSMFYVIEKLAYQQRQFENTSQSLSNGHVPILNRQSSKTRSLNARFLTISLECITKISLTKMTYVSFKLKQQFIQHVVRGINRLLSINLASIETKQGILFSQQSILALLELNNKLLINIELFEIRKFETEFMQWINNIRLTIIKIVLINTEISVDNNLLIESLQLTVKIIGQSVSAQLKPEQNKFRDFGIQIFSIFINSFFGKDHNLLGSNPVTKVKNFQDLKKSTALFKKIRGLLTLDLTVTLPLLDKAITQLLKSNDTPVNTIGNIFFFIGDLCQLGIFERNILYDDPKKEMFANFGSIIVLLLEWITYYRSADKIIQVIEVSVLLFIEKLLSEVLSQFTYEEKVLKLNNKLFSSIQESQKSTMKESRFIEGEHILFFCFHQLTLSLSTGGYQRVAYTFDVLGTLILKFKWGIKRESFKETELAKTVLNLCLNLSQNNLEGELLKLRKKLFKIITNICFDDILDDYHENIDKLVNQLLTTIVDNRWKALYDLTGICEAIDIPSIYRYFIVTLTKKIPLKTLMDQFFNNCDSKVEILAEILKLHLAMTENKSHKLSGIKGVRINYMMLSTLIEYWVVLLEQTAANDSFEEILTLLYQIIYSMIKGHHINFFQLQRICPNYNIFIKNILKNLIGVSSWVSVYPDLNNWYRQVMQQISQNLLPIILCSTDSQLIVCFNSLLEQCLTFTAIQLEQLKSIEQPSQNIQKSLNYSIETIDNIFKYLRDARKLTHNQLQIRNIEEGILKVNFNIKFQFLVQLFGFAIDSKKNRVKHIDKFCAIIQHMDFICYGTFDQLVFSLGLSAKRVDSLKEIWGLVQNARNNQENQKQFLIRIKQWFKGCDTDTMIEPECY